MSQQKTVWVNLNPEKVDLTPIVSRCQEAGWKCITEDVGVDQEKSVRYACNTDAVVSIGERWDGPQLAAIAGKNKIIVRYGAGLDNVDLTAATRYGIPVANLPGMNSPAVSEIALLHILNLGRRFSYSLNGVHSGQWPCSMPGNELDNKVLGLIGFGNIAKQLVRITSGFKRKVIAYDAFLNEKGREFARDNGVELLDTPDEVYRRADIVSLHIPLTKENSGVVDKTCFCQMKPTAYLVNTCRGGVINENDLVEALQSGIIRGYGADVMAVEPPDFSNPLLHMDNVFITSHLGALAVESEERSQQLIADIIGEHFSGRIHQNIVNPGCYNISDSGE